MLIGHFALALIAATHRKAPSLATLFVAAQFVDWMFFGFLLLGIEHMRIVPGITIVSPFDLYDMPWTHSLLATLCWGILHKSMVFFKALRDPAVAAALLAAETASVFTSSGGDGDVIHHICETLTQPGREVLLTRFHNSVHNAPAGYYQLPKLRFVLHANLRIARNVIIVLTKRV
jgi:hypothetical protein